MAESSSRYWRGEAAKQARAVADGTMDPDCTSFLGVVKRTAAQTLVTGGVRPHGRVEALLVREEAMGALNVNHDDSFSLGAVGCLDQLVEIIHVTGKQHDRRRKFQSGRGNHRVYRATMAGQPCAAEQLARPAAQLGGDRDDRCPRQHPMDSGVALAAPKHLRQGDGAQRETRATGSGGLKIGAGARVAEGQLDQAVAVENQRAAGTYSTSGHAAAASSNSACGTGPYSASSRSASSAIKSNSNCRATASLTY